MELRLRDRRRKDAIPEVAAPVPASSKRATPNATIGSVAAAGGRATRTRSSPVVITGRSSRSRSTASNMATLTVSSTIKAPTPVKEEAQSTHRSNLPSTLTTDTVTRAPNKFLTTSSVHSTYSSNTQHTLEIRSNDNVEDENIAKHLTNHLRRSLSKTFTNVTDTGTERTHTPTTNTGSNYSRSISRSIYDDGDDKFSKGTATDIEEEDADAEESQFRNFNTTRTYDVSIGVCRKLPVPQEFGGWLGAALFLTVAPVFVYYLQWSCTGVRNGCSLKPLNLTAIANAQYLMEQIFKIEPVCAYVIFQLGIFIMTALLPGHRVHLTRETYKFNSLAIGLFLLVVGGFGEYLRYPVVNFIIKHYLCFCIYGIVNAFTVALWCYIRVDTVRYNVLRQTLTNEYGKSGKFLIDYALGRQLNPKWLGLVEFKHVFYRSSLVITFLFACCFIHKSVQFPQLPEDQTNILNIVGYIWFNTEYDAVALMSAIMLFLYIIDAICFEHHLASSFELQYEGFGCILLLRYACTSYLLSAVAKYFHDYSVSNSCIFLFYSAFTLLLFGIAIKRYSCAYKYKYRLNPLNPLFSHTETIHTFQSSRLLLSGLWGRVRQPNYLGDVIALIALGLPLGLCFAWPPLISLGLLIILLLHRATRANARNKERYQSSWARYSSRVPYYILPKIY